MGDAVASFLQAELVLVDSLTDLGTKSGSEWLKVLLVVVGRGLPVVPKASWRDGNPSEIVRHKAMSRSTPAKMHVGPDLAKHGHAVQVFRRVCALPGSRWTLVSEIGPGVVSLASVDQALAFLRKCRRLDVARGIAGHFQVKRWT